MFTLRRRRHTRGNPAALLLAPGDRQLEAAFEQFLKTSRGHGVAERIFAALRGPSTHPVTEAVFEADRPVELADRSFAALR